MRPPTDSCAEPAFNTGTAFRFTGSSIPRWPQEHHKKQFSDGVSCPVPASAFHGVLTSQIIPGQPFSGHCRAKLNEAIRVCRMPLVVLGGHPKAASEGHLKT